tara:strand:- start:274 stop:612 length:339 start_codon:yes stop_codon:yes gene_type:complete
MRDPTVPDLEDRKKLMFYDSEDRQARLKIRCAFDGISQSQFFRMMITGYLEDNDLIYSFMKKCKEDYQIQGQQKRNTIDRTRNNSQKTSNKFALDKEEIESIFDTIETETNI